MSKRYKLVSDAIATGYQSVKAVEEPSRNYHLVVTGTGSVSATVSVYGSLDGVNYELLITLTASGTTTATDHGLTTRQWRYTKANVSAISGMGATANLIMEAF